MSNRGRELNEQAVAQKSPPPTGQLAAAMLRNAPILSREFFNRDPIIVGRELLGKLLIRREGRRLLAGRIVEDEAYLGANDPAAHACAGLTPRNAVLFGPPGHAYVYFIYGNYYCLNVSCMPEGLAGGVLFRALEPLKGIKEMAAGRGLALPTADDLKDSSWLRKISSGPGLMCEAFGVTRTRDNGKSFVSSKSDLQIADDGYRVRRVA